jgi:hypothetical protein
MIASSHTASTRTAATLALAALASTLLAAGPAEAVRGVKPYYSESYETKGPERGYEGFLFPDYYCSYKRYPNRQCATMRRAKSAAASSVGGWSRPASSVRPAAREINRQAFLCVLA